MIEWLQNPFVIGAAIGGFIIGLFLRNRNK